MFVPIYRRIPFYHPENRRLRPEPRIIMRCLPTETLHPNGGFLDLFERYDFPVPRPRSRDGVASRREAVASDVIKKKKTEKNANFGWTGGCVPLESC